MGVEAQNDLGGHQSFARKITSKLPHKSIVSSAQIVVTSKKKKKKVFTHLETVFLSSVRNILRGKLAQRHEIAQNFDAILPKKYEVARKFDAKSPKIYEIAQNLDTLHQPGGQYPPGPPPPTPMGRRISATFKNETVAGYR